jgi:hypothetical protein
VSQFSQAYTAGCAEAIDTIRDRVEYNGRFYDAVVSEETYANTLGEGGFEPQRGLTATVLKSAAPTFRMGGILKFNARRYRIVGIDTDEASIDLTLASPDGSK